jgi:hypothetical protein
MYYAPWDISVAETSRVEAIDADDEGIGSISRGFCT